MAPLERAMVVSYRLSIVTVAISVTIRPQFGWNVSDAQINRGVTLGPNLGVFPLEQTRHVGVAKSERPRLTNDDYYFRRSPTSQFTNVTDGQTDGQTNDMRSQYRALL